jgi:TolB-like protein/thioredoxin-like negative regulator of GroEL
VVLPFTNQSPDRDNEYFSDGLTEELISDLAAIKSLQVISRTSAMLLKGTDKDVRTLGRELGVRYVLEGSVRKAGNSLRITARLVDATTDAQLWGAKYGGTMDDVFELQERVSREIVGALGITLTSDEDRRLAQRPIENPRAFEFYLQAREEMRRYDGRSVERGEALVRRAMEIEGDTPPLRAMLTWGQVTMVRAGLVPDRSLLDDAEKVARALIVSTPDAHYGHALLGFISYERGRMADAVRHLRAALEREPNDADALFYLGISYVAVGQLEAGERTAAALMKSDPLSPLAWLLSGIVPWWTNHVAEGLPKIERAMDMDPGNVIIRWSLGYGRALAGDLVNAAADAAILRERAPDMPYTSQLSALVYAMSGRPAEALAALGDVQGLDAHHKFHLAEAYSMAGDSERALGLLEGAIPGGFHPGDFIAKYCPFFPALRGTPRFEAIAAEAVRRTADFRA